MIKIAPLAGQVLMKIKNWAAGSYDVDNATPTTDIEEADVISSECATELSVWHKPVLDIDLPVHVHKSTTPGHHHLFIDKAMTWNEYLRLLEVLADVGIIEPGYVLATRNRGYSCVRLPWVRKQTTPVPPPYVARVPAPGQTPDPWRPVEVRPFTAAGGSSDVS